MGALVGLIETITKKWSVIFPPSFFLYSIIIPKQNKRKTNPFKSIFKFQPSGHFSSPAFTLQDSAEKRTIPTRGCVETWASPQKWRYKDCRAVLCARPAPNKTDPGDDEAFSHLLQRFIHQPAIKQCTIKRWNSSDTIFISPLNLVLVVIKGNHSFTDPYLFDSRISVELVFSFDHIFELIGQMLCVVFNTPCTLHF